MNTDKTKHWLLVFAYLCSSAFICGWFLSPLRSMAIHRRR